MEKNRKNLLISNILMIIYLILNLILIVLSNNIISDNIYENIENISIFVLSIIGIVYYFILYFKKDIDLKKHSKGILIWGIIFFILNIISGIFSFIIYDNIKEKKEKRELPKLEHSNLVNKYLSLIPLILFLLLFFVLPNHIDSKYYFISYIVLFISSILIFRKQLICDFKIFKKYFKEYSLLVFKTWGKALIIIVIMNLIIQIFTNTATSTNQETLQQMFNSNAILVALLSIIYAPIVEELIFRGTFRNFIKNKYLYIIISGVMFGLLHVIDDFQSISELLFIFVYSFLGCTLASIYYKTNNICTNIYMHAIQNTLSVVGMLLLKFM